jgi:Kef-type K+ transport system membrane component KefB
MQPEHADALVVLGLLLVGAVVVARVATRFGLPAMTGQLVAGLIVATACAPLVASSAPFLSVLRQGLGAVLLFWIGSQLTMARIRPRTRAVASLAAASLVSVLCCAMAVAVPLPLLFASGPLEELGPSHVVVVALVLSATSPTIIAVVSWESGTEGRFAHTALDASVIANAGIVLLIILALGMSTAAAPADFMASTGPLALIRDLSAGLAVGGALGVIVAWSPRRALGAMHIAVAALVLLVLRQQLVHAEAAIMAGSFFAGAILASSGKASTRHPVSTKLPRAVPLVSAALFAVAGALADVQIVIAMAAPAAMLAVVRSGSLWVGSRLAGTVAGDRDVRRFGFAPLLPQAGFSLAVAGALDASNALSTAVISLVLSVVVINELVMPPVLRLALRLSDRAHTTPAA